MKGWIIVNSPRRLVYTFLDKGKITVTEQEYRLMYRIMRVAHEDLKFKSEFNDGKVTLTLEEETNED